MKKMGLSMMCVVKKMGLSMVCVVKKIGFLMLCIAYALYWVATMTTFNLGTMESYVIWTLLWLGFGVLSTLVFDRGHKMAVDHLREAGIQYDNKYQYLPAYVCVIGLIGYYVAFKYFYFGCTYWCVAVPTAYLIFLETFSHFVRASKLTRRKDGNVVA